MPYTSDKRLYLTPDRDRVVEEGDPEAAFLFAVEGGQVSDADAERYGLTGLAPAASAAPTPKELHDAQHGAEGSAQRAAENTQPEGQPTGEPKSTKAPANKARQAAPEDK